jgi:uncharacterized membrane protein
VAQTLSMAIQILLCLLLPVAAVWAESRLAIVKALSPVIVCYLVGILLGNQTWFEFDNALSLWICNVTVALAIPLLLFSVDLGAWWRLARTTVVSFVAVMLAACGGAVMAWMLAGRGLSYGTEAAGMLAGVYAGGTPNMAAIGTGLGVPGETFILLNAADMLASFVYLMAVLTVARPFLSRFLPRIQSASEVKNLVVEETGLFIAMKNRETLYALFLAAVVVAMSVGFGTWFSEGARDVIIVLSLTTLSVFAAGRKTVRTWRGSHETGQFLLLVFCVAMGLTTDFSALFSGSMGILLMVSLTVLFAVVLHVLAAALFRIDVDTAIITSVAGIFGPHMVGLVTVKLHNRDILFSGIASGLVGYAAGNYLGLGVAGLLEWMQLSLF